MKKIGIITYHSVCNFGAQLQAISTVGYLKNKGYEPIVIHWYPKDLDEMYLKRIPSEQYKCHIDFAEQNMPLTKLCQTENELLQVIEETKLDAIILGSDALFKYLPHSCYRIFSRRKFRFVNVPFVSDQILSGNPFWGSFIPKLKKQIPVFVFSVSSQNAPYNKVNKQEYDELKKSLGRFSYITVRDEWTKQMVKYFLGDVDIPVTPDPVFSFNQNVYLPKPSKEELLKKYGLPDNYVLLSFRLCYLSNNYIKEIETQLKVKGYTAVAFPMPEGLKDYGLTYKILIPLSPLEWYYLIKYAAGYIGERMHPMVVALHNAVPFFCFDEYGVTKDIVPFTFKFNLPIIFKFNKKFIWKSSKIYHILSVADLLNNAVSYNGKYKKLTPSEIIHKILTFDIEKAEKFSNDYQKYYEKSMDNLIKLL